LATEDRLKRLVDVGISEIRFHLGATNFDPVIVERMKIACSLFDRVTIETPSTPEMKQWAIKENGLQQAFDMGVTQVNCSEHYFNTERALAEYPETETYVYTSMARGGHTSPTFSRLITYDIIDHCVENDIDLIINDCSHQSRDAQIMTRELNKDRLSEMY